MQLTAPIEKEKERNNDRIKCSRLNSASNKLYKYDNKLRINLIYWLSQNVRHLPVGQADVRVGPVAPFPKPDQ